MAACARRGQILEAAEWDLLFQGTKEDEEWEISKQVPSVFREERKQS
jgi:hypothetical protein